MSASSSIIENIRNLSPQQRLEAIGEVLVRNDNDISALKGEGSLPLNLADGMIENVVGRFELPLGIATNFQVNGKDYLIPMAVEEPSVVAAASHMAKLARMNGGFQAVSDRPIMRGQIQVMDLEDLYASKTKILEHKNELIKNSILFQFWGTKALEIGGKYAAMQRASNILLNNSLRNGNNKNTSDAYRLIARAKMHSNQKDSALFYANLALNFAKRSNSKNAVALTFKDLSVIYAHYDMIGKSTSTLLKLNQEADRLRDNGLIDFCRHLENKGNTERLTVIEFQRGDIERHEAVKEVLEIYGDVY